MKQFIISLALGLSACLMISGCRGLPAIPADIETTAGKYRSLKSIKGHYTGGQWNPMVDQWQGEKHQLMDALARYIEESELSKEALIRLMGEPDEWRNNSAIFYWRGKHDYLIVHCESICQRTSWFHVGE